MGKNLLSICILLISFICPRVSFGQIAGCCNGIQPFCSSDSLCFPAATNVPSLGTQGCCTTTPNPAFYFFQIANPGSMVLSILSNPPVDIDFVLYGPYASLAAATASVGNYPCTGGGTNPLSGNAACTPPIVDCSYSGVLVPETAGIPNTQTGEIYVILITNYQNVATNVCLIQNSTNPNNVGATDCYIVNNCSILSISTNLSACAPATNTYSVSGAISFVNHQTGSGTITVTEQPSGQSIVLNPPFTNNLANYSFSNIISDGLQHAVSVVFSDSTSCALTQTYTAQPSCASCPPNPLNSGPACVGGFVQLSADSIAGVTYTWTGPNGFSTNLQNPGIGGATLVDAGYYVCSVIGQCGGKDSTLVTINPNPNVGLNSLQLCQLQPDTLKAFVGNAPLPITYNWSNGLPNQASHIISPSATTTYSCWVTDGNGCVSLPISTTVNVFPPLSLYVSDDVSICEGADTTLTALGSQGNGGPYVYTWSNGITSPVQDVAPLTTTSYSVTLSDNCSPTITDSLKVTVIIPPTATFVSDSLFGCNPVPVNFIYTGNGTIANNYYWSFGDGSISHDMNPFHLYKDAGCWDVTLKTYSLVGGCTRIRTEVCMIDIYPMPVAEFSHFPNEINSNGPYANFTNESIGAISYLWNFGDSSMVTSELNPNHTYSDTGTYSVSLIATTNKGCIDTVINKVRIDLAQNIYIPNTFTPDGDDLNDIFSPILSVAPEEYSISIFDRWGTIIFKTEDYKTGWNGGFKNSGKKCETGVYQYAIYYKPQKLEPKYYTGNVNLLK